MKSKMKVKGLIDREMEDPAYRKRHEVSYELFKLEVQLLLALEKKNWSYSDLARAMGTQKSAISRDLKGDGLDNASMARVARMAQALGMRLVTFCVPQDKADQVLAELQERIARGFEEKHEAQERLDGLLLDGMKSPSSEMTVRDWAGLKKRYAAGRTRRRPKGA